MIYNIKTDDGTFSTTSRGEAMVSLGAYGDECELTTERFVALCAGRHEIPDAVDGCIFEQIEDPTDVRSIERHAARWMQDKFQNENLEKINLFVTGLTVALCAVLKVCLFYGVEVVLWHYDRDTGEYFPQIMSGWY